MQTLPLPCFIFFIFISSSRMQTTSHSMLLKTSTAISSVNVKITAMETILKCRPCARCITGQLKSINIVRVGLNYLQITVF